MLRELFPEYDHRFLDSHSLLEKTPKDMDLPSSNRGGDVVAAWSMGSLLAHHWIARGLWPEDTPLLSLCPVFRFLRLGGFGEPILVRMEKKIGMDREAVLRDFWRRMPRAGEIPASWEEGWMAGTRRHSDDELISGLEFLRNTVVDSAARFPPRRWELLAGDQDLLAPVPSAEVLPPHARFITYAGGHLPFWECPGEIRSGLRRLLE